ncbi:hypothetical protein ACN38_g5444 [Penicillium nordicum]|uniref:Uncharacterized protein n=1 Tax=Penicillium nordicum TaxID=229535 RepID=A0A0M9WG72_9EURO|nr:hypothetical protein ACN38_g5444 [Penicillium nordicum]
MQWLSSSLRPPPKKECQKLKVRDCKRSKRSSGSTVFFHIPCFVFFLAHSGVASPVARSIIQILDRPTLTYSKSNSLTTSTRQLSLCI